MEQGLSGPVRYYSASSADHPRLRPERQGPTDRQRCTFAPARRAPARLQDGEVHQAHRVDRRLRQVWRRKGRLLGRPRLRLVRRDLITPNSQVAVFGRLSVPRGQFATCWNPRRALPSYAELFENELLPHALRVSRTRYIKRVPLLPNPREPMTLNAAARPLWVKSGRANRSQSCPLHAAERSSAAATKLPALGRQPAFSLARVAVRRRYQPEAARPRRGATACDGDDCR